MRLTLLIPILFSINCLGQPYKFYDVTIKVKLYVDDVLVDKGFKDLLINHQSLEKLCNDTTDYLTIYYNSPHVPLAHLLISHKHETMRVESQETTFDSLVFEKGEFVFSNKFAIDGRHRLIRDSLYYDLTLGTSPSIELESNNFHLRWIDLSKKYSWLPNNDSLNADYAFHYVQKCLEKTDLLFWEVYPMFNFQSNPSDRAVPNNRYYIRITDSNLELADKLGFTYNTR